MIEGRHGLREPHIKRCQWDACSSLTVRRATSKWKDAAQGTDLLGSTLRAHFTVRSIIEQRCSLLYVSGNLRELGLKAAMRGDEVSHLIGKQQVTAKV